MTTKKQTEAEQPEPPVSEHTGSEPTETADGIRWSAALPTASGVRVTAFYPDGIVATTDAKDQTAARRELRAYHTPKGA